MWSQHQRDQWPDLDERQVLGTETGSLASGGFVLADPFDSLLRLLSPAYLDDAWERLTSVLSQYHLDLPDLSWGWLHPGLTKIVGIHPPAPSDYVGWTSQNLARFFEDSRYVTIDEQLQQLNRTPPTLRCAYCYRSFKWRIAPEEFSLGLRMIEAIATDEISNWSPPWILADWSPAAQLQGNESASEPWLEMARAIQTRDQQRLNTAVQAAESEYTQVGYQIVVRGFGVFIAQTKPYSQLQLPSLSGSQTSDVTNSSSKN